ncbi:MAG: helix-turn-helix domain-containing protein, partial [Chloroflexota bacterium]
MLLHQEALQSAEASLKGGLLAQLVEGESSKQAVLADQALRYGVDLNDPFVLLMVEQGADRGSQKLLQLYRQINRLPGNWRVIVGQFAGEVLVLAQASLEVAALTESIHGQAGNLRIGVSGVQHGVAGVALAHSQCRDALQITQRLGDERSTVYFNQLGYLHTLYRAGAGALEANPYVPALRRLFGEGQTDLFHTLEVYLDAGGNGVQAAEVLCIHRSTLNYRLARIEEVCGAKLNDPQLRTNLQVALKLLRLFGGENVGET